MDNKFDLTKERTSVIISKHEENLLNKLREIGFGRVTIYLADGQPVRIEEGIKSSKL